MKNLNCFVSKFSSMPSWLVFKEGPTKGPSSTPTPTPPPTNEVGLNALVERINITGMHQLNRVKDANKDSYEQRKQATTNKLVAKYSNFVDKNGWPIVEDAAKSELRAPVGAEKGDIFVSEPGIRGEPPTFRMLENGNFRCINYGESYEEMTPDKFEAHILNTKQQWDKIQKSGKQGKKLQ